MALSEFLFHHREQILQACLARLHEDFQPSRELARDFELFFDEVAGALRRHDGASTAHSPLPGPSAAAARLGKQPQRSGVEPAKIPRIFGLLASTIGAIGEQHQLSFSAREYRVFTACLDSGVATSIEHFWLEESEQRQRKLEEGALLRPIRVATTLRQLQASTALERAISITLEVDESLHVEADEPQLSAAIGKLLHNAIKYSCNGGHVTLSCRADDGLVFIEVEDECGGLPETSPLLRLPSLGAPTDRGLTLNTGGLAFAGRTIQAMAGRLYVENVPQVGCICGMAFATARPSRSSRPPSM